MAQPKANLIELIFGRWRSQVLYTGVELGVFEIIEDRPKHAVEIADQLDVDRDLGYRLFRALGSLGLLEEMADRRFSLTSTGELLREDHPESLRGVVLLEEGPAHYALWTHLPALLREGEQNAFEREFGDAGFVEHREADPEYAAVFDEAMTSFSKMETAWAKEMLDASVFSDAGTVCDVAGGRGYLLSSLLADYPHLEGTVLELPQVVSNEDRLAASEFGVEDRCRYIAGDMFEAVPEAEVYLMKNVLHDWNDDQCTEILSTIREAAPPDSRLFSIERVVPEPDTPHFAKLFDIHMLVATDGRERTTEEFEDLLADAGWEYKETHYPENELMGAIEAAPR